MNTQRQSQPEVRCPLCLAECEPVDLASTGACTRCHEDGADAALRPRRESGEFPVVEAENTN
jgi:hypothetical protein